MSNRTADVYAFWRACLKDAPPPNRARLPTIHAGISNDNPQAGIWKTKIIKGGPFVPVRIWLTDAAGTVSHTWQDGLMLAGTIDGVVVPIDRLEKIWTFCKPVSKADYEHYVAQKQWAGDAPNVSSSAPVGLPATDAPAQIGHNTKTYGDDFDGMKAEIEDYAELCRAFLAKSKTGLSSKAEADQAANMADKIGNIKGGLARRIETTRETLTRPHIDAQSAINAKYKPLVDIGVALSADLRRAAGAFAIAEQRRLQAIEDERARAAQAEAKAQAEMQARADADRAARTGNVIDDLPPIPEYVPASAFADDLEPAKIKVQLGGANAAKRSVRIVRVAKVDDHQKTLAHFADAPEVRELVAKLAQRVVTAGGDVPGVSVTEDARL